MTLPECNVRFDVGGKTLIAKENCKEAVIVILDGDERKAALYSNASSPAMIASAAAIIGALNHHLKCRSPHDPCPFHTKLRDIEFDLESLLAGAGNLGDDSTHEDHAQ